MKVKIFEIHVSRFWPKFRKIAILVKIFENLHFDQNFQNISISVKTFEIPHFGENCRKISILVKFSKNLN